MFINQIEANCVTVIKRERETQVVVNDLERKRQGIE